MTGEPEGIKGSPSVRLVALFIDEHTERGVALDKRTKGRFGGEVKRLLETYSEEALADAIPRLVDAGAAIASLGEYARTAALRIAKAERGETIDEEARRRVREFLHEHGWPTGCETVRGSHGMQGRYHPFGTDPIEERDWPYTRPTFAELVEAEMRDVWQERVGKE